MLGSTSQFKLDRVIFMRGNFAIAEGEWKDAPTQKYACRWHDPDGGVGYPQTYGKPQWMALPPYVRVIEQTENGRRGVSIVYEEHPDTAGKREFPYLQ